jgi:hypothetical protein
MPDVLVEADEFGRISEPDLLRVRRGRMGVGFDSAWPEVSESPILVAPVLPPPSARVRARFYSEDRSVGDAPPMPDDYYYEDEERSCPLPVAQVNDYVVTDVNRGLADRIHADGEVNLRMLGPENAEYGGNLRMAFSFLRMHADRRYSDSSLMRLSRAADAYEYEQCRDPLRLPIVIVVEAPSSYDELTEVKHGGVLGVTVAWQGDDPKAVIAVHREVRRRGIATTMVEALGRVVWNAAFWVGQRNTPGQQFLLSTGRFPVQLNSRGALQFAVEVNTDDGAEDVGW